MQLTLGIPADAADGRWGVVADLVVDPVAWTVTHLVVEPRHHHERSRLVPLDAVASSGDRCTLELTAEEIEHSPVVEQTDFIRIDPPDSVITSQNAWESVSAWPFYPYAGPPLGTGGEVYGYGRGTFAGADGEAYVVTKYDVVPRGTIEIRRASEVRSCDDHVVGHVDGFVVEEDGGITHLVLEHGHLWAHREITIPLDAIERASGPSVQLSVTRDAVGDFPSVPFHRHRRR